MARPSNLTDLYLAPVALHLDEQLASLSDKHSRDLEIWIAMEADIAPRTIEERRALVLKALQYSVDTHGWDLAWDDRGVRLSHEGNSLVLGISESLKAYVDGATV